MELIRISDSKLKVMLSAEDMEKYDFDCEEVSYEDTGTRAALWQILDEAKHQTGFDAACDRVFIQVYPSRAGGCEMYVTKIASIPGVCEELAGDVCPKAKKNPTSRLLYVFASWEDLFCACRQLDENGYAGESEAYLLGDGAALALADDRASASSALKKYAYLDEYGRKRTSPIEIAYIREHGECIAKTGAVAHLARLA